MIPTGYKKLIDIRQLSLQLHETALAPWSASLQDQLDLYFRQRLHGEFHEWMDTIARLPEIPAERVDLDRASVGVSSGTPRDPGVLAHTENLLRKLHPWRKGPYDIHGIAIDTEWRSDWKWDRLAPHVSPLNGRVVLDVGCGNGYHCWRMAGAGARLAIGIDPTQRYLAQFLAIRHFLGREWPVHLLPFASEDLPRDLQAFDTVFSMGILYHRRSPIDHLLELKGFLRNGGELILETLVREGAEGSVMVPEGRYAKMRNVWFIPSPATLAVWLKRCGFRNVKIVDVSVTSLEEQRSTDWMRFESLSDFLDPDNRSLTLEGYPAPRRAILTATKP